MPNVTHPPDGAEFGCLSRVTLGAAEKVLRDTALTMPDRRQNGKIFVCLTKSGSHTKFRCCRNGCSSCD
jgi:hypothetical protein